MRIGIDARFLTHPQRGGFKSYTEGLVTALAQVDGENEYILYLDRIPDSQTVLPGPVNFSYRVVLGETPMVGMVWREQVSLARQAARDRLDLLHATCLTAPLYIPCPLAVTMHDMIWLTPDQYSEEPRKPLRRRVMEWYYRYISLEAVKKAVIILTVSQASKDEITRQLGTPAERILVTHLSTNSIFNPVPDPEGLAAVRVKYSLPAKFILAIGSADPRKNISTLLQAYRSLPEQVRDRFHLVIVWSHAALLSSFIEQVKQPGLSGRVHFLQQVSVEELARLYQAADLFVFPSLKEGFGLPPLEAMSCGTPVIAANNSSIPEVVGDAALLFQAGDTRALAGLLTRALEDPALRVELMEKGLRRAGQFSWTRCGSETLAAYRRAVNPGRGEVLTVQNTGI